MQVAIRDAMLYTAGFTTALEGLRALEIDTVEVAIDRDGVVRSLGSERSLNLTSPQELDLFRQEAAGAGVCALLCAQDFNAEDSAPHQQWVARAVRAAEELGVSAVRIDSIMTGQKELPLDERIRIYAAAAEEALRATAGSSVALGIENHGAQGNDPEWMRGVLGRVADPRLGVTLDVGNWYWYGHPLYRVYEIYREFGPRAKATHVKNIRYPDDLREVQREVGYEYGKYCCPLDEGDLDMARVARVLREAGYDGPLTIEDESIGKYPLEERPEILRRDVECLRNAV